MSYDSLRIITFKQIGRCLSRLPEPKLQKLFLSGYSVSALDPYLDILIFNKTDNYSRAVVCRNYSERVSRVFLRVRKTSISNNDELVLIRLAAARLIRDIRNKLAAGALSALSESQLFTNTYILGVTVNYDAISKKLERLDKQSQRRKRKEKTQKETPEQIARIVTNVLKEDARGEGHVLLVKVTGKKKTRLIQKLIESTVPISFVHKNSSVLPHLISSADHQALTSRYKNPDSRRRGRPLRNIVVFSKTIKDADRLIGSYRSFPYGLHEYQGPRDQRPFLRVYK